MMRRLTVLVAVLSFARTALAVTVWIDTDVAIGSPIRDVDDGYALAFAFHSPELRIVGISTSYGNGPRAHTTRVAREMAGQFGSPNLHVYPGASSANDLGRRTEASDALAQALTKNRLTYIALGPLTNLATFLALHPAQAARIERVILVGGREEGEALAFGPTKSFKIHDANVFKDPIAAERVLKSAVPITLASVMTGAQLSIDGADLRALEAKGGVAEYLARRSKWWLWFWRNIAKTEGGPIFDALAIVIAARPELTSMSKRYAKIEAGSIIVSPRPETGTRPVQFCSGVSEKTKRVVLERIEGR